MFSLVPIVQVCQDSDSSRRAEKWILLSSTFRLWTQNLFGTGNISRHQCGFISFSQIACNSRRILWLGHTISHSCFFFLRCHRTRKCKLCINSGNTFRFRCAVLRKFLNEIIVIHCLVSSVSTKKRNLCESSTPGPVPSHEAWLTSTAHPHWNVFFWKPVTAYGHRNQKVKTPCFKIQKCSDHTGLWGKKHPEFWGESQKSGAILG